MLVYQYKEVDIGFNNYLGNKLLLGCHYSSFTLFTHFLMEINAHSKLFWTQPSLQIIAAHSNFTDLNFWTLGVNLEKRPSYIYI